ncbi:hypothetical protein [Leifsonia sp. Leaf264]|uniref:hypothetical protein n=1 Tax=Leifsonia sp. Leaf264 TaxID=1736314 RepID=UPI000B12BA71|nr:hypothetical protein [Leifsonia sp. Leaf264]
MEFVIAAVVILVLAVVLIVVLELRARRSRPTSNDDAPQDSHHAEAMARAYAAGVARDLGTGPF